MPRKAAATPQSAAVAATTVGLSNEPALESTLNEMAVFLESRRAEFQSAADMLSDILGTIKPKPRIGRPPKATV